MPNKKVYDRKGFKKSLSFNSLVKLYKATKDDKLLKYIVTQRFKRKLTGKWKGLTKYDYIKYRAGLEDIGLCNNCKKYLKLESLTKCRICINIENTTKSIKEKYGVSNISQLEEVKKKKVETWSKNKDKWISKHKQTIKSKYGVDNISQLEFVKDKKRQKFKLNKLDYSKFCSIKNDEFGRTGKFSKHELPKDFDVEKIKSSPNQYEEYLRQYYNNISILSKDIEIITKFDEFKKQYWPRKVEVLCKKCNRTSTYIVDSIHRQINVRCKYCDEYSSYMETYLYDLLTDYGINVLKHYNRGTKEGEIDLYLPDYNFGIECQGLYFHANEHIYKRDLEKHIHYTSRNIRLFYVYEDDFNTKKDIVIDMLKHKLNLNRSNRIYARNTKVHITNTSNDDIVEFFNKNHIHGFVNGSEYIILTYNSNIVSGMILSPNRFSKDKTKELEIVRFCNLSNYTIVGGFSKCLKHSKLKHKFKNISFFVDSSFGSNLELDIKNRYSFLEYISLSKTDYSYYLVDLNKPYRKYHRLYASKYKLDNFSLDDSLKLNDIAKIFRPFSWKLVL